MSDSETLESSGEEEGTDDQKEEEEYLIENGMQTRTMKGNGTMVTVITRNVKEVSWPPPDQRAEEKNNSLKALPDLNEKVHLGRNRRQKMDLEMKNFQGSTAHYSSNPFCSGAFQPGKMRGEERWKPQQTMPGTYPQTQERPKLVLRETSSVLTQTSVGGSSGYKIPPGTTRQGQRGKDAKN